LKKFDGVIEAVHYQDGKIVSVRAFERRVAAFTDRVILPREELIQRLQSGKTFVTGKRKEYMAGTFETGPVVHAVSRNGSVYLSTRADASRDELEGVPLF
jgi:hypothetical protein